MKNSLINRKRFSGVSIAMTMFVMAGGLFLTGCASQVEVPPQVSQSLTDLRDQLTQGKAQIQTTSNAARDLTNRPQADLTPQINRLLASINDLDDLASNHRKDFASADEKADAYFAQWDKQLQGMSEDLAEQGQQRRAQSMATYAELKSREEDLKADFRPFMASLLEVATYLKTDTTAAGVKVVTPQIKTALNLENRIQAKADAVIAQIDAMRGGK